MSYAPRVPLQIDWASPAGNNAVLYYKYHVKGSLMEGFQDLRTGPAMRTYFHESYQLESFVQSNQQRLQYEGGKEATEFSSGTIQKVVLYSQEGFAKRQELEQKEGLKFDSEDGYCEELKKRFPRQCPKQNYEFQGVYHPPDPTEANTPKMLTVTMTGGQALPSSGPAPAPNVVHRPAANPSSPAAAPQPLPGSKASGGGSAAAQMLANPAAATQKGVSPTQQGTTAAKTGSSQQGATTTNTATNGNTTTTTTTTTSEEKSCCCVIL